MKDKVITCIICYRYSLQIYYLSSIFIYRFQESGILKYWSKHIRTNTNHEFMRTFFVGETKIKHLPKKLAFKHVSGAFYILATGLFLAKLVFLLELTIIIMSNKCKLTDYSV